MSTSPYRIERASAPALGGPALEGAAGDGSLGGGAADEAASSYLARLAKLLPADVTTLYLTFHGGGAGNASFLSIWSTICLALAVVLRIWGTRDPDAPGAEALKTVQWPVVFITAVSFVLWVLAMGHSILGLTVAAGDRIWVSAAIAIWTLILPIFYKGR